MSNENEDKIIKQDENKEKKSNSDKKVILNEETLSHIKQLKEKRKVIKNQIVEIIDEIETYVAGKFSQINLLKSEAKTLKENIKKIRKDTKKSK
ncbi:MAG: hypothetical protein EAZ85_10355 [Bacteroidetes bacterium]|nr:MAG: hypothetical protein EAZ85_10355 [Bacteroidota bacterium]TAG85302.1 MAG: hypothetical protein EAZ20_15590 [Bacteroidota bacterium]